MQGGACHRVKFMVESSHTSMKSNIDDKNFVCLLFSQSVSRCISENEFELPQRCNF